MPGGYQSALVCPESSRDRQQASKDSVCEKHGKEGCGSGAQEPPCVGGQEAPCRGGAVSMAEEWWLLC